MTIGLLRSHRVTRRNPKINNNIKQNLGYGQLLTFQGVDMKATEARKLVQDRTFKLAQDKLGEIYSTIKTYASQHNEGVTIHLGEIHFSVIYVKNRRLTSSYLYGW